MFPSLCHQKPKTQPKHQQERQESGQESGNHNALGVDSNKDVDMPDALIPTAANDVHPTASPRAAQFPSIPHQPPAAHSTDQPHHSLEGERPALAAVPEALGRGDGAAIDKDTPPRAPPHPTLDDQGLATQGCESCTPYKSSEYCAGLCARSRVDDEASDFGTVESADCEEDDTRYTVVADERHGEDRGGGDRGGPEAAEGAPVGPKSTF